MTAAHVLITIDLLVVAVFWVLLNYQRTQIAKWRDACSEAQAAVCVAAESRIPANAREEFCKEWLTARGISVAVVDFPYPPTQKDTTT